MRKEDLMKTLEETVVLGKYMVTQLRLRINYKRNYFKLFLEIIKDVFRNHICTF